MQKEKPKEKKIRSEEGETLICCQFQWHFLRDGPDSKDFQVFLIWMSKATSKGRSW